MNPFERGREWKDLTDEEKEFWNKLVAKRQKVFQLLEHLKEKGCPMCKAKPKCYEEWRLHMYTTHGKPPEILDSLIEDADNTRS